MTTTEQESTPGWCCTNCLVLFANGDTPSEMDEAETKAWLADIDHQTEGSDVTLGLMFDEHDEDCPNVDHESGSWLGVTDCSCEDQEFSRSGCDTCGSRLAGSRHAVTFWFGG